MPVLEDANVVIGPETSDDVGAYRLADGRVLLLTVDFFTPVVDDPYLFGAIAAANSLSDIFAKGVTPLVALNLLCFPSKKLPESLMVSILKGGRDKAAEVGVPIIGGHSIDDSEPKYGLAVVAIAQAGTVISNAGARAGDHLFLTKPLGSGIISTAIKRGVADAAMEQSAVDVMVTLNDKASRIMAEVGVNACTDVTGYGLLGHLREMLIASQCSAEIMASRVPVLEGVSELARADVVPGGARNNKDHLKSLLEWSPQIPLHERLILCDPQTSGGLLIAVAPERAADLRSSLQNEGVTAAHIGTLGDQTPHITIRR